MLQEDKEGPESCHFYEQQKMNLPAQTVEMVAAEDILSSLVCVLALKHL